MRLEPGPVRERSARELKEFSRALESPEAKEAVAAFAEKRRPDFSQFD
jgi:enoyl-CoA hydratase/carnithine racemase